MKRNESDLIPQSKAAQILGLSRAAIHYLVETGKLPAVEKYGRRLVYEADVRNYKPKHKQSSKAKGAKAKKK
jgi:predicted DNA-binding transcriptional regulator AlpA